MAPHKYPMISMPEAIDIVLSRAAPLEEESLPFADAVGRVLASEVTAPRPHPPFPASIMDGYAVRAADVPGTLRVVGAARAGAPLARDKSDKSSESDADHGRAVYITTGAPVPPGFDAVVPIERVRFPGGDPDAGAVAVADAFSPGANVRSVGSDIQRGEVLLRAGDRVGPHELGIAALAGVAEARTRRAPLVAVLSTGDELADPFAETESSRSAGPSGNASASLDVTAGSIFDANRHMLLACAREAGAEVMDLGIARDDPDALADAVARAVDAGADVVVTSGGVSEGDKDHLKDVLLGSRGRIAGVVHFGRVMMKPGKPLTFAEIRRVAETKTSAREETSTTRSKTVLAFGLPGNPVSAAVTFALAVAPAVRRMLGWVDPRPRRLQAVLAQDIALDKERPEYHRATLDWEASGGDFANHDFADAGKTNLPLARSTGRQISSRLTSMRGAEVLLELPRGPGSVAKGSVVSALVIRDIGTQGGLQMPRVRPTVVKPKSPEVLGAATSSAAGIVARRDDEKKVFARRRARAIAVVTHPFVFAKSASDLAREADVPDSDRAVTDEGNDDGAAVLEATRRFLRRAGVAEGGDAAWRVFEARAENGTSRRLALAARAAAETASIVLIAPSGPSAVSSQAAVVAGTDLGFPGLAPRMRAALERAFAETTEGEDERSDEPSLDGEDSDAEDAIAALAYRESGFGINAGQVAGAVVASLPCTNCEEALREGLTKMVIVPREKWEGLVS